LSAAPPAALSPPSRGRGGGAAATAPPPATPHVCFLLGCACSCAQWTFWMCASVRLECRVRAAGWDGDLDTARTFSVCAGAGCFLTGSSTPTIWAVGAFLLVLQLPQSFSTLPVAVTRQLQPEGRYVGVSFLAAHRVRSLLQDGGLRCRRGTRFASICHPAMADARSCTAPMVSVAH